MLLDFPENTWYNIIHRRTETEPIAPSRRGKIDIKKEKSL